MLARTWGTNWNVLVVNFPTPPHRVRAFPIKRYHFYVFFSDNPRTRLLNLVSFYFGTLFSDDQSRLMSHDEGWRGKLPCSLLESVTSRPYVLRKSRWKTMNIARSNGGYKQNAPFRCQFLLNFQNLLIIFAQILSICTYFRPFLFNFGPIFLRSSIIHMFLK